MDNNAHDIIPVVCRCPHGPAGHLLQGGQPPASGNLPAQRNHKDILLSNIGDTSAITHSTLALGTKRTPTPLLSTSSPKRQKPTPQQGIKRPPMRPLAPKKSTKVHKAAVATVPKQNDIRTFFSKKARTDVADTNPYTPLCVSNSAIEDVHLNLSKLQKTPHTARSTPPRPTSTTRQVKAPRHAARRIPSPGLSPVG